MERKKASDFPQTLLDLFDAYVHGGVSRLSASSAAREPCYWVARADLSDIGGARRAHAIAIGL